MIDLSNTLDPSEFLPAEPRKGFVGFYPYPVGEWNRLPLPLRSCTVAPGIDRVITRLYLGHSGRSVEAHWYPTEFIRHLFCAWSDDNPVSDTAQLLIRRTDGQVMFGKWWQDRQTGAYAIASGAYGDHLVIVQGGYKNHLPEGIYRAEDGRWQMRSGTPGLGVAL